VHDIQMYGFWALTFILLVTSAVTLKQPSVYKH
jgi:hypothetical protein